MLRLRQIHLIRRTFSNKTLNLLQSVQIKSKFNRTFQPFEQPLAQQNQIIDKIKEIFKDASADPKQYYHDKLKHDQVFRDFVLSINFEKTVEIYDYQNSLQMDLEFQKNVAKFVNYCLTIDRIETTKMLELFSVVETITPEIEELMAENLGNFLDRIKTTVHNQSTSYRSNQSDQTSIEAANIIYSNSLQSKIDTCAGFTNLMKIALSNPNSALKLEEIYHILPSANHFLIPDSKNGVTLFNYFLKNFEIKDNAAIQNFLQRSILEPEYFEYEFLRGHFHSTKHRIDILSEMICNIRKEDAKVWNNPDETFLVPSFDFSGNLTKFSANSDGGVEYKGRSYFKNTPEIFVYKAAILNHLEENLGDLMNLENGFELLRNIFHSATKSAVFIPDQFLTDQPDPNLPYLAENLAKSIISNDNFLLFVLDKNGTQVLTDIFINYPELRKTIIDKICDFHQDETCHFYDYIYAAEENFVNLLNFMIDNNKNDDDDDDPQIQQFMNRIFKIILYHSKTAVEDKFGISFLLNILIDQQPSADKKINYNYHFSNFKCREQLTELVEKLEDIVYPDKKEMWKDVYNTISGEFEGYDRMYKNSEDRQVQKKEERIQKRFYKLK